jgi:hypothetical protein
LWEDADLEIDRPRIIPDQWKHPLETAQADAGIDFEVRAHVSGAVQNGLFQGACRAYPDVLG